MLSQIDRARARLEYVPASEAQEAKAAPATPEGDGLFGPDGPSFRDVLDAINPLNHIPIVSSLFEKATEHQPSTASQLVGGALLGGPIGFVASLASTIFKEATGQSPGEVVLAAVDGETDTTQLASNAQSAEVVVPLAETVIDPQPQAVTKNAAQVQTVSTPEVLGKIPNVNIQNHTASILDLYGASQGSAHASYKKAQLLPYLSDVTMSKVL